jgi:Host cell surface-exposed lipoprotein
MTGGERVYEVNPSNGWLKVTKPRRLLVGSLLAVGLIVGAAVPVSATPRHKVATLTQQYETAGAVAKNPQTQFYASMTTAPVLSVVRKRALALSVAYDRWTKNLDHVHWTGKSKKDAHSFETYLRSFSQFLLTIKFQTQSSMSSWSDQLTAIGNAGHEPFDALAHDMGLNLEASTPKRTTAPTATVPVTVPPTTVPPTTVPPTTVPPTTTTTKAPPVPTLTQQQQSAVEEANQYLNTEAFSQQGLIDQLDSPDGGGYSVNDATVAVDSLTVNWNTEAVQAAHEYLQTQPFSCSDLIQQLDSPYGGEFTVAQATYGATQAGDC